MVNSGDDRVRRLLEVDVHPFRIAVALHFDARDGALQHQGLPEPFGIISAHHELWGFPFVLLPIGKYSVQTWVHLYVVAIVCRGGDRQCRVAFGCRGRRRGRHVGIFFPKLRDLIREHLKDLCVGHSRFGFGAAAGSLHCMQFPIGSAGRDIQVIIASSSRPHVAQARDVQRLEVQSGSDRKERAVDFLSAMRGRQSHSCAIGLCIVVGAIDGINPRYTNTYRALIPREDRPSLEPLYIFPEIGHLSDFA
jgi:hypothetical protein